MNNESVSYFARVLDQNELLLMFENIERARVQSASTVAGQRAEPPPRTELSRELRPVQA